MAQLDATGWDWTVGRQQKYQQAGYQTLYCARAWRDRPRIVPPVKRVRDMRDIVQACGYTPEDAARRCAEKVQRLVARLAAGSLTLPPLGCGHGR